jgi:glycine betaine/choline ABC-type transport system substrate-binding protein
VVLGEILAQLLEARKVPVDRRLNLGGTFICHRAIVAGDIDVYVEYTGTALTAILNEKPSGGAGNVYRRVREVYENDLGLAWSEPLGFDNTFVLAMKPETAEKLGIRKISDLKAHEKTLRAGVGHEFFEREDGYRGLAAAYDLKLENAPRGIELGLIYQALMEGEVDFVVGSATDGLIDKFGLVVLGTIDPTFPRTTRRPFTVPRPRTAFPRSPRRSVFSKVGSTKAR